MNKKFIIGLVIGICIAAGVGIYAQVTAPTAIENATFNGDVTFVGSLPEGELAFGAGNTRFPEGIDIPSSGELSVAGALTASSDNVLSGTTTIRWLDASFQIPLNFQQATSSDDNNVASQDTRLLVGTREHTGADLLCTDVWLDIYTANGIFAYGLEVGTSTSATSSAVAHLINENATGFDIATSGIDILSKEDDEGTTNSEVWDLNNGEFFAATQIFLVSGATSSASFTAAGGNLTEATLHVNCRTRY